MVQVQPGHRLILRVNCVLFNVSDKPQLLVLDFFVITVGQVYPNTWTN